MLAVALLAGAGCGEKDEPSAPAPARPEAAVVARRQVAPRIVDLRVRSPALGSTANVRLLTPDGWPARDGRRWPLLYLLHGCCDTYDSWTRETGVEDIAELRDVLVVMPEGGEVGFYSDWRKGPAWERFHLTELRSLLERDYGAGTRRAVAGLSMGGLGALAYAARHPGVLGAAASFSGVLHPLLHTRFYLGLFEHYAPDPLAVWGDPKANRDVWAAHDPTELAPRLRGTALFVSAGDGDPGPLDEPGRKPDAIERGIHEENEAFVARLRTAGIPVTADFYGPGTHSWPYFERELRRALPVLLPTLR